MDVWVRNAASTADLNRDLLSHPANSSSISMLGSRVQDAKALAERCATGSLPASAKEKFTSLEKLDHEGTRLWNCALQMERRPEADADKERIVNLLLNGWVLPLAALTPAANIPCQNSCVFCVTQSPMLTEAWIHSSAAGVLCA